MSAVPVPSHLPALELDDLQVAYDVRGSMAGCCAASR